MLLPLLLQLDPNTVKSVGDHAPSTPWAVAGMLALALALLAAYVLKDKLTPKTSQDTDGRSAPPCFVPAGDKTSAQSVQCSVDHSMFRERFLTLDAHNAEVLRTLGTVLRMGEETGKVLAQQEANTRLQMEAERHRAEAEKQRAEFFEERWAGRFKSLEDQIKRATGEA